MNFQASISRVTAVATSTLQADGSISINVALSRDGADGATASPFSNFGHYIDPQTARPLLDAPPSQEEAGLGIRDLVTARGLRWLVERNAFPLVELLPVSMRPSDTTAP